MIGEALTRAIAYGSRLGDLYRERRGPACSREQLPKSANPFYWDPERLRRLGLRAGGNYMECLACGTRWQLWTRFGRLPEDWWQCHEGCNAPRTEAPEPPQTEELTDEEGERSE